MRQTALPLDDAGTRARPSADRRSTADASIPPRSQQRIAPLRNFCLALGLPCLLAAFATTTGTSHAESRGLLANPGIAGQPVKGVYFFPGETRDTSLYTANPTNTVDEHWLSDPASRPGVIDHIVALHVNTIVLSYWSNMPQWAPMDPGPTPLQDVVAAAVSKPAVIMPALESGSDPDHPQIAHWEFHADFPYGAGAATTANLAPGLLLRVRQVIAAFGPHMDKWAQITDRNGVARHAIFILHAYADRVPSVAGKSADQVFAEAFQAVADEIDRTDHVKIGFTLDTIPGPLGTYTARPGQAGPALERVAAVLAIQGYASEVFSGKVINSLPNAPPHDNNKDNLYPIVDWKAAALHDWVATHVPVIYDVSSGFDGRFVWKSKGTGFWGDNFDYTDDRWRNALSQFKGNGIAGITFDTWNGYTEGYAAAPTREHGTTIYDWVRDLYDPDPRVCSHTEYVNGRATHQVIGAICEKWVSLGGDRGQLGVPLTDERPSEKGRISTFASGMILWSGATGAHEVHGLIRDAYMREGLDAGCLGLPISDEEPNASNGRISRFHGGVITWKQGDVAAIIRCEP
jgi:hypothetical protein